MPLKLHQLKIFCALAESATVAEAAEKMHCVPSNVSTRIKELERLMNVALVQRQNNRLGLTPEGRAFYLKAKELLDKSRACLELFQTKQLQGDLQIGALDVAIADQLQNAVVQFMQQHPLVSIALHCASSLTLMEQLLAGELDLILTDGPIEHPYLESLYFAPESLALVTHFSSFEAFAKNIGQMALLAFGKDCYYRLVIESWLKKQHFHPKQTHQIESYPIILAAVRRQLGFSVMPISLIKHLTPTRDLFFYPLQNTASCDLCMVWYKENVSPTHAAFVQTLITHGESLSDAPKSPR